MFGFGDKEKEKSKGPVGEVTLEDGSTVTITQCVDCIGDSCPRPQLMTKKALSTAASGDVIEVLVDNSSSLEAIPPMLGGLGATLLETRKSERRWEIFVQKN